MENSVLTFADNETDEAEVLFEIEVTSSDSVVPENSTFYGHKFESNECLTDNAFSNQMPIEPVLDLADFFPSNNVLHDSVVSGDDNIPNEIVRAVKIKSMSKKEQARLQRESGTSYLGYSRSASKVVQDTVRPARNQGPSCFSSFCRKSSLRHCNLFTDDERAVLFEDFWEMSWQQKQMYVCQLMEEDDVKQHRTVRESRRGNSFKFFLKNSKGRNVQVCRAMFLSTFGLKQKVVKNWFMNRKKFGLRENPKSVQSRKNAAREKSDSHQALLNRKIRLLSFLIDFPKLESHYCRKDTDKEYFETEHRTLIDLYKQYVAVCKEENTVQLSFPVFSGTLKNLNFSLFKPRKDQCDTCSAHKVGNVSIDEYDAHRKNVHRAAEEKTLDVKAAKSGSIILLCMDTQAVVLCPRLKASALYYRSKLQLHNFTLYNIVSHDSTNYIWDETEGDLQSSSFTSIVIQHLEKVMKSSPLPIVIYSDGCGYQNRNVVLSNALRLLAIKHSRNITQKFLEVGHTHMECDSTHACIERKTRDMIINLPCDFEKAVKEARDKPFPFEVVHLTHTFFSNYDDKEYLTLNSIRPGKKPGDPKVNDIRCIQYTGDGKVLYKLAFDDLFKDLPQKVTERPTLEPKQLHQRRLPIKFAKWTHLQELKPVLDTSSHCFYDAIPHLEEPARYGTESEKLQEIMQKVHLVKKKPKPRAVKKAVNKKK
ncbi:hypothetical protein HA402_013469 [Bradysia odoriphaga]|nr:hypothetical protein HA402_013469 [Bradysia odoriphaga]